jgi:hypothetical protein
MCLPFQLSLLNTFSCVTVGAHFDAMGSLTNSIQGYSRPFCVVRFYIVRSSVFAVRNLDPSVRIANMIAKQKGPHANCRKQCFNRTFSETGTIALKIWSQHTIQFVSSKF